MPIPSLFALGNGWLTLSYRRVALVSSDTAMAEPWRWPVESIYWRATAMP